MPNAQVAMENAQTRVFTDNTQDKDRKTNTSKEEKKDIHTWSVKIREKKREEGKTRGGGGVW
jgi:hypothetical protein